MPLKASEPPAYAFVNGEIFTGHAFLRDHALIINGSKIHALIPRDTLDPSIETVDLEGQTIAPGFVDLQVNGGGGVLFNDTPTVEGINTILEAHKHYGTTDMLPTLITDSIDVMQSAAQAVNTHLPSRLPGIRGIHFEGPFLDSEKAGIHPPEHLRRPNDNDLSVITSLQNGVTLVTLAPNVVPCKCITMLQKQGIVVSLGHSDATYDDAMHAFAAGASCTTHLYNAMSPLQSREPGVVGAALDHRESYAGIIVDGYHCDYASVRIAAKAKPAGRLFLVTDAMASVGTQRERFSFGPNTIVTQNGRCTTENGTLAGSALDMATAVRNCIEHAGIDRAEALRMASTYPAACIGLADTIGLIRPGYDANLVLFDAGIHVSGVVIQGIYETFTVV